MKSRRKDFQYYENNVSVIATATQQTIDKALHALSEAEAVTQSLKDQLKGLLQEQEFSTVEEFQAVEDHWITEKAEMAIRGLIFRINQREQKTMVARAAIPAVGAELAVAWTRSQATAQKLIENNEAIGVYLHSGYLLSVRDTGEISKVRSI